MTRTYPLWVTICGPSNASAQIRRWRFESAMSKSNRDLSIAASGPSIDTFVGFAPVINKCWKQTRQVRRPASHRR